MPISAQSKGLSPEVRWFVLTHACSALRAALRVRRIGADGRSTLRSFASKGQTQERPGTKKTSEQLRDGQKIGNPYWLLTNGYSLNSFSNNVRFADLVVMAERLHPIPFRTRP